MTEWLTPIGHSLGHWLAMALFVCAILLGFALNLLGLFGNWVILGALGISTLTGFIPFPPPALVLMLVVALLAELAEYLAAGCGTRRFGGSRGGSTAAIVGGIVGGILGSPLFPVLGTLLGAFVGAFFAAVAYEFIQEKRTAGESFWSGIGAAVGKVIGMLLKFAAGILILLIAYFSRG